MEDWTPECQAEEERQKEICNIQLYVITKEMSGVFSIAEVVDASNKNPESTLFYVMKEGFSDGQLKSLEAVETMVDNNGACVCTSLEDVAACLTYIKGLF